MRKLINIFIILSLSISSYSQEVEIGTIFTIEFSNPEKNMNFELISKNSYNGTIELVYLQMENLETKLILCLY
jgi:hypothetical protein